MHSYWRTWNKIHIPARICGHVCIYQYLLHVENSVHQTRQAVLKLSLSIIRQAPLMIGIGTGFLGRGVIFLSA